MKVDLNDKVRQQGEYNVSVRTCLECSHRVDTSIEYALGWFQVNGEWALVWECPKCFAKWWHHDKELDGYGTYKIINNINQIPKKINIPQRGQNEH